LQRAPTKLKEYVKTARVSTYGLSWTFFSSKRNVGHYVFFPTAELIKKSEDEFCRDKVCPNKGYGQPQGLSLQKQYRKNYALIYIDKYTIFR